MKELDFNTENSVKVTEAVGRGLVEEYARDVIRAKITGEQPYRLLEGMAKVALVFTDILTNETGFNDALKFLSERGVTIE